MSGPDPKNPQIGDRFRSSVDSLGYIYEITAIGRDMVLAYRVDAGYEVHIRKSWLASEMVPVVELPDFTGRQLQVTRNGTLIEGEPCVDSDLGTIEVLTYKVVG